jgi:hypothetical protein
MPREQKSILFGEFQANLENELKTMSTDHTGRKKNQICSFLGNFFVRVQPNDKDTYELQVRKSKLRDLVIQKISSVNEAKGNCNKSLLIKLKLIRECPWTPKTGKI